MKIKILILNILEETTEHAKRLVTSSPVLSYKKLQSILANPYFKCDEIKLEYKKQVDLESALGVLKKKIAQSVKKGNTIIHLIEYLPNEESLPINALEAQIYLWQSHMLHGYDIKNQE